MTNVELFFDLVYVFAVTQLSQYLLAHRTIAGVLHAGLLLTMVWLLWSYTTWVTNWLDPNLIAVRLMLLVLAAVSLLSSAALPAAFERSGLIVGAAYLVMQVGRSVFTVRAMTEPSLRRNFQRILAWCVVSGALAVAGGFAAGAARDLLWVAAVGVDLLGGVAGFYTPGLGRSATQEWTIEGGHFAERCQAFILIALGESIVVIGATLARLPGVSAAAVAAFLAAFLGSAGMWWLYFDKSAEEGARVIARSADPGRLGRSAYHFIHPLMVAGIIVSAAADEIVLSNPGARPAVPTSWLILGGTGLYIAGHAAFKATVWRRASWPRIGALAVLALLGLVAPHVPALILGGCAAAVVVTVAAVDYASRPAPAGGADEAAAGAGAGRGGAGEPDRR